MNFVLTVVQFWPSTPCWSLGPPSTVKAPPLTFTPMEERQEEAPCLDFMREDSSFGFGAHGGRQKESQHGEKWTWAPTPNSEASSNWQLLAKEELVFSNKYIGPPTHISHTSGPVPHPAEDGQHKTNSVVLSEISFLSHNALVEPYFFIFCLSIMVFNFVILWIFCVCERVCFLWFSFFF